MILCFVIEEKLSPSAPQGKIDTIFPFGAPPGSPKPLAALKRQNFPIENIPLSHTKDSYRNPKFREPNGEDEAPPAIFTLDIIPPSAKSLTRDGARRARFHPEHLTF